MPQVVNGISLDPTEGFDKITSTDKITKGYFTGDEGILNASDMHSSSISDTNEKYYFGISKTNTTGSVQFHVAYGNVNGYGSDTDSGGVPGKTKAIYKQWSNILLSETEVTGGFTISKAGSSSVLSTRDEGIFILSGKRELFKDRINKKNWTIHMSGSQTNTKGGGFALSSSFLWLTDDSKNTSPTPTPAGPRYNIVSGSDGNVVVAASTKTYGWFYPDQGVLVFSAAELSASIPGSGSSVGTVTQYNHHHYKGFGTTTKIDNNYHEALRFINCAKGAGSYLKFRSEEDQTSVQYFCRARAAHCNFSNNPTFVSGSQNELRNETMKGNPTVYITGVQLYDGSGTMVATGNLSTPLKKNFSSEATIKVKLTF